jgi:diacylglycerol kinase (ATP)
MSEPFEIKSRLESFSHAFRGIAYLVKSEHNARIHALATIIVIALGGWLDVSRGNWVALIVAIALVWIAEAMNTAIELVADVVSPNHHPVIGQAKDVAAAGVLLASLSAAVIGGLVLGPKILAALSEALPTP